MYIKHKCCILRGRMGQAVNGPLRYFRRSQSLADRNAIVSKSLFGGMTYGGLPTCLNQSSILPKNVRPHEIGAEVQRPLLTRCELAGG
jgi:hypothetical protein